MGEDGTDKTLGPSVAKEADGQFPSSIGKGKIERGYKASGEGETCNGTKTTGKRRPYGVQDGPGVHGDVGILRSGRREGIDPNDPPCPGPGDELPRYGRYLRAGSKTGTCREGG